MRKSIWFGIATLFMLCVILGCSGIQIQGDSQELIAKMSARHVGQKLAVENPGIALMLVPLAEMVLDSPTANAINFIDQLKTIAIEKIRDPLLKADIRDLTGLIKVDSPTLPVSQVRLIRAIASGLLEGINTKKGILS